MTFTQTAWVKYYSIAGQAIAMNDGSGPKYMLADHLGSVVAIADSSGALISGSEQRYLPFGQVRSDIGPIVQIDFGYTGQRNLGNMGLMDYKARFYDPTLGRFIQPDTVIPSFASPQSLNRYSYVDNSPILLSDPSGNFGKCNAKMSGYLCKVRQNKAHSLEDEWRREAAARGGGGGKPLYSMLANGTPPPSPTPPPPTPPQCPLVGIGECPEASTGTPGPSIYGNTPTPGPFLTSPPPDYSATLYGSTACVTNAIGLYSCGGEETVVKNSTGERQTFIVTGTGWSFGAGGSTSHYIGTMSGIRTTNDYSGGSHAFGFTISAGPVGITAAVFWSDSTAGAYAGFAPGAQASVWGLDSFATPK